MILHKDFLFETDIVGALLNTVIFSHKILISNDFYSVMIDDCVSCV
jgi:hypothetical protein